MKYLDITARSLLAAGYLALAANVALSETIAGSKQVSRAELLIPHLDRIKRIVFTKHFDMGGVPGAHYAYTEGLSDARGEWRFEEGSSLCLLEIDENTLAASVTTLIHAPKGVIRDPDVSYDGKTILFAWKKSARHDDYHLYEMTLADRSVRQLTFGLGHADYEGAYLPRGNIVFSSTRCVQVIDCAFEDVSNLYMCDRNGKYLRRIGFDQVTTNFPTVTPDGSVVYTRWDYNDRGQMYTQGLFQMNPDGTAQREYYGNNSWFPTSILHARGIPGTAVVMAILSGHHTFQQGKLAVIDPTRGRQEESGVQLIAPVRQHSISYDNKPSRETDLYGQDGDQFQYPYPLDQENFLITFRPSGEKHFGIYFMTKDGRHELLASDAGISCNQPIPLAARRLPVMRPSRVDYSKSTGVFAMENIHLSQSLDGVEQGSIKKLRVVALKYRAAGIGNNGHGGPGGFGVCSSPISYAQCAWDAKVVLGEADVYADGSACFEVPARTPVYFQAVDANGHVVQTMRSWSTLQPGETFSCVGCHEDKRKAPPSLRPSIAARAGPKPLMPFYDVSGVGFSYRDIIQPIWDNKCVRCHADENGIDLRGTLVEYEDRYTRKLWSKSYRSLVWPNGYRDTSNPNEVTSKYLSWLSPQSVPSLIPPKIAGSIRSPLIAMLEKGHQRVAMTREEMDKISCWIDLLLPHYGDYPDGMSKQDEHKYKQRLQKRTQWEKQEARNIAQYIKHHPAPNHGIPTHGR